MLICDNRNSPSFAQLFHQPRRCNKGQVISQPIHPLIGEREYARLLRNMVIEDGLMFLSKLEKAGIKLS